MATPSAPLILNEPVVAVLDLRVGQHLGADYFDQRYDTAHETRRLVRRLEGLGHTVTITPAS